MSAFFVYMLISPVTPLPSPKYNKRKSKTIQNKPPTLWKQTCTYTSLTVILMTIHFIPSPHTHMYTHTHTGIECIKKYIEMLAWLFLVLFCFLAATLKCYSCASVDRPEDCQTTIECPSKDHVGENSRLYSILT